MLGGIPKQIASSNKADNQKLREFFDAKHMIMLKLKDFPGPLGVVHIASEADFEASLKLAAEKIKYYSLKTRDLEEVCVAYWGNREGEIRV